MLFLKLLTGNYLINVGFGAWAAAQLLKTLLTLLLSKKFVPERLVGAGGMPSAHSATVCALTIGMARKTGYSSPEFALALILAVVVMYDAMGVRRAAGEQAKALNILLCHYKKLMGNSEKLSDEINSLGLPDLLSDDDDEIGTEEEKTLKEFLGHTPLEVLAGALLGILVAMLMRVK